MTPNDATAPEYVVVGHCALDLQPDGSFLPGGTALYSALTAARMGMHTAVLTAGDPAALMPALAPFRDAFAIHILPTPATTTFENIPTPEGRKQWLHGWSGPILQGDDTVHVETFDVTVRDETGAGDVFAAAWAVQLARGASPDAAARVGCAAASLSITAPGLLGIPTESELAALLATNTDGAAE